MHVRQSRKQHPIMRPPLNCVTVHFPGVLGGIRNPVNQVETIYWFFVIHWRVICNIIYSKKTSPWTLPWVGAKCVM